MASDIAEKLLQVGKLKPISAPEIPPGRVVSLTEDDDIEDEINASIAQDVGAAYFITYIKSNNASSKRRISVKKVSKNAKGNIMLNCYCHERKAFRSFRADRIQEAIDLATGEVIVDFLQALNNATGSHIATDREAPSVTALALSKCKHALNILVFLGRCDDRLHPFEIDIIAQYLMNQFFDANLIEQEIYDHLNRLYPDHETYISSIEHVHKHENLPRLMRFACQMIQADEIITDEEHKFVEEMQQYIGNQ